MKAELTIRDMMIQSLLRVERWHPNNGLEDWSPLEWAGAMAGEAGEACNAAKKLKRIETGLENQNHASGRHLIDATSAKEAMVKELADTVFYAILAAARIGYGPDKFEQILISVFNNKSSEYGFPEKL